MSQADRARAFHALHIKGDPLVLYNIWDAGSAQAVAEAGVRALATGSWSVAGAQGYADGQQIPLDLLCTIAERITETVDLPLSVDIEGGYATLPDGVRATAEAILATGAVGVNFEDQVVGGSGLHEIADQTARIAALVAAREAAGVPLFLNARTDVFLKAKDGHGALVDQAIERAAAYADAGADGFFVPDLTDAELIGRICDKVSLPVNVMMRPDLPNRAALADLGVARISHGPGPYRDAMAALTEIARTALG